MLESRKIVAKHEIMNGEMEDEHENCIVDLDDTGEFFS